MLSLVAAAALAAATAAPPTDLNPNAVGLFDRESALAAWAVRLYDSNHDGWLTSFEAQSAFAAFKRLADTDGDGRITVSEYAAARAFVVARYNLAAAAPTGQAAR